MESAAAQLANLTVRPLDEARALELLSKASQASWRQFPANSAVAAEESGAESSYLAVEDAMGPFALANVRIKRLPVVPTGLAMITQGPVMLRDGEVSRVAATQALSDHVVGEMGLTLRINPPVEMDTSPSELRGFEPVTGSGYETFLIDLAPSLDKLRANLNGKWRTDLRRGEKGQVEISRSSNAEDFHAFQPLLTSLAQGKGFAVPQDAEFFAKVAERARGCERIEVHLARHEGRVIGGHVGAYSGNMSVYLLGAINEEGRALRASFLLQWAVIEYSKSLGMECYDLGGADEIDNPHVFRFKKRMGGVHYKGPPMMERRAAWPRGQIVRLAEQVYAKARG